MHAAQLRGACITYSPGVWKRAVRRVVHRVHQSFHPAPAEVRVPGLAIGWRTIVRLPGLIGRTATARGLRANRLPVHTLLLL
jgi:hypothetical protein